MRKYIDIINEFQMDLSKNPSNGVDDGGLPPLPPEDDDGGRGEKPEMVSVTGICWYENTEDQDEVYSDDLPTEVVIPVFADPNDEGSLLMLSIIEGELEARFGYKHNAHPAFFEYKFV